MVKVEDIRELSRLSGWRTAYALATDWLLIALNFALLMYFPNPLIWLLGFVFAARQQLALAILMHDGAHRRLFASATANDWLCQFFCGAPLFFSIYSYQKLHLKHHRDPLAADDPDLSLIGGYPITRASFVRKLARDACGISYFKFIRYFIHMARKPRGDSPPKKSAAVGVSARLPLWILVLSVLVVNFALWSSLFWLGHGWLYLFFWVLPAVTALQVLLRIRGIAEHAGYTQNSDQRLNARTVLNPMQTFFFAPHHVAFHIEHHAYPAVPFYNLPRLHRLMKAADQLPPKNLYPGYVAVLREIIR